MKAKDREQYRNNSLQYFIDKLGISRWDYLLIGDGSGTTRERACGWCSVLIDRDNKRQVYSGRLNYGGSNIVAETMAYTHPIMDLAKQNYRSGRSLRLHIISDCEHVVDAGNNVALRRRQAVLWAPVEVAQRLGIFTTWHWWRRDEIGLNQLCHELANTQRRAVNDDAEMQDSLRHVLEKDKTAPPRKRELTSCTKFRPRKDR